MTLSKSQADRFLKRVPHCVDCGLGFWNFHRIFNGDQLIFAPYRFRNLVMSLIAQRVLGRRYRCLFSLHQDIDKFQRNGEGCFIKHAPLCSVYFVIPTYEGTFHAPRVFTAFPFENGVLLFLFILHRVSAGGHFAARVVERRSKSLRHPCDSDTTAFLLVRLLDALIVSRQYRRLTSSRCLRSRRQASHLTILLPHVPNIP